MDLRPSPELGPGDVVATWLEQQIIHARDNVNVRLETLLAAEGLLESTIILVKRLIVSINGSWICRRTRYLSIPAAC
jgi:hypothetical protein